MDRFLKKKGKEGTRGGKTITKENAESISFYRNMSLIATLICFLGIWGWMKMESYSEMFLVALSTLILLGANQFLRVFGTPNYGPGGEVVDPALDLNGEGGVGEHVKDLIILSSATQVLVIFSKWALLLLLLIPARVFWMAWVNIIAPWLFAPGPEEEPQDSKKAKKMERKMKRMQIKS